MTPNCMVYCRNCYSRPVEKHGAMLTKARVRIFAINSVLRIFYEINMNFLSSEITNWYAEKISKNNQKNWNFWCDRKTGQAS